MDIATSRPPFIPERWKDRTGAFYDFKAAWWYRDAAGELQGVVARFDSEANGKQVIPYFKRNGSGFKTCLLYTSML